MNAIERRNKRVKRFAILRKIFDIEQMNCLVCPNRSSTDNSCCKTCPVPDQLNELGKQLICMSDRANTEKIHDEPATTKKGPGRRPKEERGTVLTREIFLQERASGVWVAEIQHKYKMSRTALYHYLKKWGFRYLSQDQAKKLLGEETA